jgi:undecaprenyl diphosphate synthase
VPPTQRSLREHFSSKRAAPLLAELDLGRMPRHVAIIMDGNGRWAAKRGLPRLAGHRAGAKALRQAITASIELGIGYLTVYSFSSENWTRPSDEVFGLMRLFVEVLERELDNLDRKHVRVLVIGDLDAVPADTADAFRRCIARTASNDGLTLVVALNYGARAEIVAAAQSLAEDVAASRIGICDIDERVFASRLSTVDIPDPDLLIRTSGEMRVSNFLLWQIAYAEFWVTSVLWPDFKETDLLRAIVDYQKRSRRFGGRS